MATSGRAGAVPLVQLTCEHCIQAAGLACKPCIKAAGLALCSRTMVQAAHSLQKVCKSLQHSQQQH